MNVRNYKIRIRIKTDFAHHLLQLTLQSHSHKRKLPRKVR